jgi:DNA-binding beta-propeller fold protein YncE
MVRRGRILKALTASLALALMVPPAAQAVKLHPGDVLTTFSEPPQTIARINPRTGGLTQITSGDRLKDPWQLVVTPTGRILVADYSDHSILSVDPGTGAQALVSSAPGFAPVGLARAASGKLIASDYTGGAILSIDPGTGAQTPISTGGLLQSPSQLAVAPSGRIFVADEGNNHEGIYAINPGNGAQTALVTAAANPQLASPYAVALTAGGRLLFADYDAFPPADTGGIFSLGPSGGSPQTVSSGQLFEDPIGVARSFQGPLFVADSHAGGSGAVIKVNPTSGDQTTLAFAAPALDFPGAVAVVPPRCFGGFATIVGSPKKDKLMGTRFADVIAGAGGNDRIRGLGGKDRICGGKGKDTLIGGKGRDKLLGGPGKDTTRQ